MEKLLSLALALWRWAERVCKRIATLDVPSEKPHLAERPGPYLAMPIVDVEFIALNGDALGTDSAVLVVRIASSGLLIVSAKPVTLEARQDCVVHGYSVWFGDDRLDAVLPRDVPLAAGDGFSLDLKLPIILGRDIGTNLFDPRPPPEDPPPEPGTDKAWNPTATPTSL